MIIFDVVPYEQESKTLFRNMNVPPEGARKKVIDTFIKGLKADGIWALLDTLWVTAAHSQQASRLNWKTPGTFTLTEVNSPAWVTDRGYTSNGSTSYLDTNFAPGTHAAQYTLNNASAGVYLRTDLNESTVDMGDSTSGNRLLIDSRFTGSYFGGVNDISNLSVAVSDSLGMFSAVRTSSSARSLWVRGISVASDAQASSAVPVDNIYILCRNNGGAATFSNRQNALSFLGSGSINQLTLYNRMQTYMTSLGANV
jgi:hypothetical protein